MTTAVPVWVLLVVAAIGAVATLGSQYISARLAAERTDQREKAIFERELGKMREQWIREDRLRTFEQRRDAYLAHASALSALDRAAARKEHSASGPVAVRIAQQVNPTSSAGLERAIDEVLRTGTLTRIYAPAGPALETSKVATTAHVAYGINVLMDGEPEARNDAAKKAKAARSAFLSAVRLDLGVPDLDTDSAL